jgi:hypothetical protein
MKSNFPTVDAKAFTAMQNLNIRELSTCKNIRPILPCVSNKIFAFIQAHIHFILFAAGPHELIGGLSERNPFHAGWNRSGQSNCFTPTSKLS